MAKNTVATDNTDTVATDNTDTAATDNTDTAATDDANTAESAIQQDARLLVVHTIICDGKTYNSGDEFPLDNPEAERLFNEGHLVPGTFNFSA
jgi:hypothetical protein